MAEDLKLSDHELLLKLLWMVEQIQKDSVRDREAYIARAAVIDGQIAEVKKNHEELCTEVEGLQRWKVQVIAYGTGISGVISILVKIFWK